MPGQPAPCGGKLPAWAVPGEESPFLAQQGISIPFLYCFSYSFLMCSRILSTQTGVTATAFSPFLPGLAKGMWVVCEPVFLALSICSGLFGVVWLSTDSDHASASLEPKYLYQLFSHCLLECCFDFYFFSAWLLACSKHSSCLLPINVVLCSPPLSPSPNLVVGFTGKWGSESQLQTEF